MVRPVLPRAVYLVLVLAVLAQARRADAGVSPFWQELGGSARGNGVSQAASPKVVSGGSVAVDDSGRPVVVYTEYPDGNATQGAIIVRRWTGSTWEILSGPAGIGQGHGPQVQVASSGAPYVAWLTDDGSGKTDLRLRAWDGSAFVPLGGSDSAGRVSGSSIGITAPFSLALDANGNPILAFLGWAQTNVTLSATPAIVDSTVQVYVRRWTGIEWEFVGSDFGDGGASNARSFTSSLGSILHHADTPSLAMDDNGEPVVAFTYHTMIAGAPATNTDVYVTRWTGSAWVAVGPAVPAADGAVGRGGAGGVSASAGGSSNPSLAADATGKLALAWEEEPASGGVYVWLRAWNGTAWTPLGGSATSSGLGQAGTVNVQPRVGIDPTGRPIVAWSTLAGAANPMQIFVRRWNGATAWEEMGSHSAQAAGISDAALGALAPALALTPAGAPTIAWLDVEESGRGQVFLRRYLTATTYTVTVLPRDNGSALSTNTLPDPIRCGAGNSDCRATLDLGTEVILQATPIAGSRFVKWTGAVCDGSANATCVFRIPARDVSVSPTFKDVTALTLTKSGQGTITSTPAGISCGPACSSVGFDFARGIVVKLNPRPPVGWSFTGFSGACSGATCSVDATGPTALVGASFSIQQRRLTVSVVGQGIVGGPGVACNPGGTPCALDVDYGTRLPLTATAAPGHRFTGWSQGCKGLSTCNNRMTVNRSVTATFKPEFGLTVTKPGNSTGTIGAPGITCGVDCRETYLGGTKVTLRRSAPSVSTTFRWGGDCASRGSSATCTLTLNAHTSVSADYSLKQLALTVIKNGTRLGTVTGLAGAISCGGDCTEMVDYGAPVTLVATPSSSPAAEFVSWAGCTTAASPASCSFTMTANKTVTATFQPRVSGVTLQALSPSTLAMGGIRQLSAVATFSDGSQQNVTTQTLWASSAPSIAAVSATGLVTGRGVGTASITGTFRDFVGSIVVEVDSFATLPPSSPAITVSCAPYGDSTLMASRLACLPSGLSFSVLCQATGIFTSAGAQDITDQVTWTSGTGTVARPTGLVGFNGPIRQSFRIVGNGTAILRATQGRRTSSTTGTLGQDAWVVQGVASTVRDIQVTPGTASVAVGGDRQLRANATLSSSAPTCMSPPTRDFSTVVTWGSSHETRARVNFFGKVTGIAPGGVTITATDGAGPAALSDAASITVVP